jgi:hypothetical protein
MNKKQLIVAAIATVMSVSGAHAVSTISEITNGGSGTFEINPDKVNGDVGYRAYENFNLGEGDVANLIYQAIKNGETRDLGTFINLVDNKVQINGLLNAVTNNGAGHAVFISPKGMVVGASGVLNVGTLSVVTPTDSNFSKMKEEYNANDFTTINNISTMRNGDGMNYGGHAPVSIEGKVLARDGVDIRGSQVDVAGTIINGYKGTNVFSTKADADAVFNTLVNTSGITASASQIANNSGRIVIKSGADTASSTGGINITGTVANLNETETAITNHGSNGLQVSGLVATNGKLNVYNNNTASALTVSGKLTNKNADLSVTSKGGVDITNTANITTAKNLEIVNKGGALKLAGSAVSNGKTDIVNEGSDGMNISGTVGNSSKTSTVRIVNNGGKLTFSGKANASESVSLRNQENGTGMEIGGTVKAGEGVLVHNQSGAAKLTGSIDVEDGNVAIYNEGTGKLTTTSASSITNGLGNVAIKNESTGGMSLNGNISNEGEIAINNLAGAAEVNGTIDNVGNMGIINKENGTGLTIGGTINNEGKIKLVNSTGVNGLTVNGVVNNKGQNLYVYNDAGHTTINGTLNNTEAGNLYVLSRANSTGITTGVDSVISNETGNLAIKHNGAGAKNGIGMNLNGAVSNDGEIGINNYTGNMNVAGTITQNGTATIGVINRAASEDRAQTSLGGNAMTVDATINGHDINIKNNGSGDMTVNGEITHNGRLNVLGNEGNVILGGKIHNTGSNMTYVASRANGDGIDVQSTFNADSTNDGMILVKNITGQNGLKYDGTMTSNGQAEIYNKVGDMTVTGAINGEPAVVLNTGDNLTVADTSEIQGNVTIVNRGSEAADVADKYKNNFHEILK